MNGRTPAQIEFFASGLLVTGAAAKMGVTHGFISQLLSSYRTTEKRRWQLARLVARATGENPDGVYVKMWPGKGKKQAA